MRMGPGRLAAVALLLAALACGVVSAATAVRLDTFHDQRSAASAIAKGTVIEDDIGDEGDIRVRWRDLGGRSHTTRFGIYDTDRYVKGKAFDVRFDPAHPDNRAFPADRDETSAEDDLYAGLIIPWGAAGLIALWWIVRLIRTTRVRHAATTPASMRIYGAFNERAGLLSGAVRSTWSRIETPDGETAYQRVQWHPMLARVPLVESVDVGRSAGALSITLPNGVRLTPIGRTRDRPPPRFRLQTMAAMRSSLADSIVGADATAHDPWIRAMATRAGYGAVIGLIIGGLTGSTTLALIGVACGAALVVNVWALSGSDR